MMRSRGIGFRGDDQSQTLLRSRIVAVALVVGVLSTCLGGLAAATSAQSAAADPPGAPTGLTVNDQTRPLEVEGPPLFGWLVQDADGNELQSGYQVEVTRDRDAAVVWDSGKVGSSQQEYVRYGAAELARGESYSWRVRTWDRTDLASPWSETARFDTGISNADWGGASWIRRTTSGNDSSEDWTLARKQVGVSDGSPVVRARAYVAAMGQYELHVNGQTVYRGDSFTYPGEGYYQTSDITSLAQAGQPLAVGVLYHYWTCTCQGRANGPASPNGPSGLLVRVVVDHADGSRESFVSDGTWKVTKATMYTNATLTTRNGDSGDRVERYDARVEIPGWDTVGFNDSSWANATVIGPHPRPTGFTHLNGGEHRLGYETVRPVSVQTLADGTVVADFGRVIPAMPGIRFENGASGRALTVQTSFRLLQTTLAANANPGDTNVKVASTANFTGLQGALIEIDSYRQKEVRRIVSVGTAGAAGTGVTLDAPLARAHPSGRTVWGPKVGTTTDDTQGSNLSWFYTQKAGTQTAQAFTYWGWRYLQVNPPGAGEPLDADDIFAVVQHSSVRPERRATFESDDAVLNDVFELMMRSGIYSSHEVFVDTPTREKGQFLGDTVDISFANMLGWAERDATQRAIREFIYSQIRYWNSGTNAGRLNAVYPNGDGMRDIPDYTEFFPGWVMRYYLMTGDRSLVEHAYPTMRNISTYVHNAIPITGGAAGLVYNLPGGSGSYVNGIIDWPPDMRYGYPHTGNGGRTIHNAEAVDAFRSTAAAATLLGNASDEALYRQWADDLKATINGKLLFTTGPDAGLYSPGLSTAAGNPQLTGVYQHAQTYPIVYGIAPEANLPLLANRIVGLGMNQGPMTLHVLFKALALVDRPDQIVSLLTNPNADGPGKILANDGTFMWEEWNPTGAESHSHGWGSWGLVDVLETLLGVEVTSPAGATVRVAPPRTALQFARGSFWTPRGEVSVDWRRTPNGLVLDLDLPVNVRAEVELPVQDSDQYSASGAGAPRFVEVRNGRAIFDVGSGASHFEPNGLPIAVDDAATVTRGGSVDIDVLANDSEPNGDPLTIASLTQGAHGTVTQNADGTLRYTHDGSLPDSSSAGSASSPDSASAESGTTLYRAAAPGDTNIKVVSVPTGLAVGNALGVGSGAGLESVVVTAVGQPASSTTLAALALPGDTNIKVASVTALSVGDPITIDTGSFEETRTIQSVGTAGAGGTGVTLTAALGLLHASGAPVTDPGSGITFTPALTQAHASGEPVTVETGTGEEPSDDSFTYTVSDGRGGEDTATVSITVVNAVPVAVDDAASVFRGEAVDVDVLANDTDQDGDALSVDSFTQGANGAVTQNADGTLRYLHDGSIGESDSFGYTVSDGNGGSDAATVTITVVNRPPDAIDDAASVFRGGSVDVDVLANDTDPDGDVLALASFTQGAHGTVSENADGSLTYVQDGGPTTSDSFTYTVSDGRGGSDTATVAVTVTGPDLVITDLVATEGRGDRSNVTASVRNAGTSAAPATATEFVLDGTTVIGTAATPALAPGETANVTVEWITEGLKGKHQIRATADKGSVAAETNESNNSASRTVTIKGNKIENGSFE